MPFPGLNIDNLPFFALIAACADGTTMIHAWVYENRAIYLTELTKVGGQVQLLDPHRVMITGPTPKWRAAEVMCPPALRPGVVILLAMLAPAPRCCATSTSSTAATRTSPSGSTPSGPRSRRSATSDAPPVRCRARHHARPALGEQPRLVGLGAR
jgi:hypothetical protein